MTNASAKTEQATNGQMGQPAACMMENNGYPLADKFSELWLMKELLSQTVRQMNFAALGSKVRRHGSPTLWITLWVTMPVQAAKQRRACHAAKR